MLNFYSLISEMLHRKLQQRILHNGWRTIHRIHRMFIVLIMHNNIVLLTVMTIVDWILVTTSMMMLLIIVIRRWWFAVVLVFDVIVIVTIDSVAIAMIVDMFFVDCLDFIILRHMHLSFESLDGYVQGLSSGTRTGG